MFDNIRKSILTFGDFSENELQQIFNRLRVISIKRNEILVNEGKICREFYFINHGGFRHYRILEDGSEEIINLYLENDWMFDYRSLISQKPCDAIIQAIEDCEIFELSGYDFHELVKSSDAFFRVGSIFQQATQNQDFQNNRMSPEEKYALLMTTKPQIIRKFPIKYIASFMGITPETLSRVRRKLIY